MLSIMGKEVMCCMTHHLAGCDYTEDMAEQMGKRKTNQCAGIVSVYKEK